MGGFIEVEIVEGIDSIRNKLKQLSEAEDKESAEKIMGTAKVSPHSSKSSAQDKLGAKPRMAI